MYAVIRSGGKQYRVAPGDVIRVERTPADGGQVVFSDILAVSPSDGQISRPQSGAQVIGRVIEEGRGDKVLVFHFKRKKQYKKLAGHRQPFTAVRITEIAFDGQKFTAPEEPVKPKKEKKAKPETHEPREVGAAAPEHKAEKKAAHAKKAAPAKHAAPHKAAAHKKPAAKKPGKGKKK
ncbi:MAG: 50S ribosomal protein L21 [Acidobacteriia bacterium]|nr:50S ribosomal protein L21 [Terriglobia bacterium]